MSTSLKTPPTLVDLHARRDEIVQLAQQYGAFNVRIVGLLARGQAGPGSDVDLLEHSIEAC